MSKYSIIGGLEVHAEAVSTTVCASIQVLVFTCNTDICIVAAKSIRNDTFVGNVSWFYGSRVYSRSIAEV